MSSLLHLISLGQNLVKGAEHLIVNELFIDLTRWGASVAKRLLTTSRLVAFVITCIRHRHHACRIVTPILRVLRVIVISLLMQDQISSGLRRLDHLSRALTHELIHLGLFRLMGHLSLAHSVPYSLLR